MRLRNKKRINFKLLVICLLIVYGFGLLGSIFTSQNVNSDWYNSVKPSITPPGWVFPIVWNILFFLIALSMYFSWVKANKRGKSKIVFIFGANLILNFLWSLLYFGEKNVFGAFVDLILLWFTILGMIFVSWKIDRKAAYLLIPYLVWVSFAGFLNYLSLR